MVRGVRDANQSEHAQASEAGGRPRVAVLIPVKPFASAKTRLSSVRTPAERETMARSMARSVLNAAQGLRVAIIASETALDVRRFALINGARFLAEPEGEGLNGAVQSGVDQLELLGYQRVVVVHSDLPLVSDVSWLADTDGITVVADRTGHGTNALSVPSGCGFRFSYGAGSLDRHCGEARRLGFDPKVVVDPEGISADVDVPSDLTRVESHV